MNLREEEGREKKSVSWKGAVGGGAYSVREYQVEPGHRMDRKVEEITKRKNLQEQQETDKEVADKLKEWRLSIPHEKPIVTDDVFLQHQGWHSLHHYPLFLTKEQRERIDQAKETGRHTYANPNLLFIKSKGRFVPMGAGRTASIKPDSVSLLQEESGNGGRHTECHPTGDL